MVILYKNPEFAGNPYKFRHDNYAGMDFTHVEPNSFIELTGEWTAANIPPKAAIFQAEAFYPVSAEHSLDKTPCFIAKEMKRIKLEQVGAFQPA